MSSSIPSSAASAAKYNKRKRVCHGGRLIYEWEQSLDELLLIILPPPTLPARLLSITILPNHLTIGITGNPPFLNEPLQHSVRPAESVWTLADGELCIQLAKAEAGLAWTAATIGPHDGEGELTAREAEAEKERMLLERMGREHGGFDFSQATVNGQVPDARHFMGGIDRRTVG